ncbi:MAG: hypothetical protein NVS4B7_13230 [Ktedonobacteraceae bacterium]
MLLWANQVKTVYDDALAWTEQGPDPHLAARQHQQARVAQQQCL